MTANISFVHDHQIAQHVVSVEGESQELIDILHKIVRNAGALLDVHNCSVALLDAARTTLVTLAALQKNGRKPRHTRFRLSEGVAGWVAEHQEPLVIHDVALDPRFKRLGRTPIGSIICVPLINDGNFIGTLTASSTEMNAFSAKKAQMMTIFAEQAVLAIINARHAELAQHQARQLEMLMDLSHGITTRLDPDHLYRTILADVQYLVPCDLAILYRYQESIQEIVPVAELVSATSATADELDVCKNAIAVKTTNIQQEKISLYSTNSVVAWAAVHLHPMLRSPSQPVLETDIPFPRAPIAQMIQTAEMATPLVSKNVLYGVLSLQRKEPFSSEELRLIRNLSNMAAAALENVSLFQRVHADQKQLRAILASSSDGIALLGNNACFIEANTSFGQLFGIDPAQVVGMECLELLECGQEDGSTCHDLCRIHKALREEQPLPYSEIDLTIKGMPRSIGLSITPVVTANEPICLMVARDITAIRDATRMKAHFISMITHELRSPLNTINGYLDLALTGVAGKLNDQLHEFLLRARSGSENLYALLEDLLLISRADAGQWRLSRELIDLREIIDNAVEELELTARDNNLTITIADTPQLPSIYADAVRMQQVLRNLISNALRFTSSGGEITITARVQFQSPEGREKTWSTAAFFEHKDTSEIRKGQVGMQYEGISQEHTRVIVLQVSDTGCGIAPEFLERIFDRFYQVAGSTMSRKGQGLGLSIVKMIVELHGGLIQVESTPSQGSTFTCILPCLLS